MVGTTTLGKIREEGATTSPILQRPAICGYLGRHDLNTGSTVEGVHVSSPFHSFTSHLLTVCLPQYLRITEFAVRACSQ